MALHRVIVISVLHYTYTLSVYLIPLNPGLGAV